jgi:hypothetical protein
MRRSKVLGGGAVVVLMVLAAGEPGMAASLTEQQWRKQVGAICTEFGNEIGALDAELLVDYVQATPEQAAVFVGRAAPVFEHAIDAIDALREPEALKAGVHRFVRTATKELDALRDNPSILIKTEGNALPKSQKIGRTLGIKCTG